jgi:hypothetical protein
MAAMDAQCEQPELRAFSINIRETAKADRGRLVAAAITILRAWHVGRNDVAIGGVPSLGGFEQWSMRVRDALRWLGCADPCVTIAKTRSSDPELEALQTVIVQWRDHLGSNSGYTIQDVIGRAINIGSFYAALLNVAASRAGGTVSNDRLGRWLKRVQRKIVMGFRFVQDGSACGYPLWKLTDQ